MKEQFNMDLEMRPAKEDEQLLSENGLRSLDGSIGIFKSQISPELLASLEASKRYESATKDEKGEHLKDEDFLFQLQEPPKTTKHEYLAKHQLTLNQLLAD